MKTVTQAGRFDELDGLRGMAAIGVVWYHIRPNEILWIWSVMDMFFTLSSFLLGRVVIPHVSDGKSLVSFYVRRAQRIWPLYFTVVFGLMVMVYVMNHVGFGARMDMSVFWRYLTFSQYSELIFSKEMSFSYIVPAIPLWSLAVEEHFYILFPLLIMLLRDASRTVQVSVICAILIVAPFLRLSGAHFYTLPFHLDAFAWGTVLAACFAWMRQYRQVAVTVLLLLLVTSIALTVPYLQTIYTAYWHRSTFEWDSSFTASSLNVFWFALIGLLALNPGSKVTAIFRFRLFVYFGKLSYALYLVHFPILFVFPHVLDSAFRHVNIALPKLVLDVMTLPLILIVAHVLYVLVDQRAQKNRSAIQPKTISTSSATSS